MSYMWIDHIIGRYSTEPMINVISKLDVEDCPAYISQEEILKKKRLRRLDTFYKKIELFNFIDTPEPSHKFSLILDLDNTVVHASSRGDSRRDDPTASSNRISADMTDFFDEYGFPELFSLILSPERSSSNDLVMKLRPGVRYFLMEISHLYDIYVYTHGTTDYTECVIAALDPHHR